MFRLVTDVGDCEADAAALARGGVSPALYLIRGPVPKICWRRERHRISFGLFHLSNTNC